MNLSQNGTTFGSIPDYYIEPIGVVVARLSFETAIALCGVIGNILVCIVIVAKQIRGRTSMHYFLLNLAFADIGVLTIIFPLGVLTERIPRYWPFGRIACLYIYPFIDTFYGASIWFVTSIAFQRYRKIVKAKDLHGQSSSTKRVLFDVLIIWLVSFLVVSLPLFFIFQYKADETNGEQFCWPNWDKAPHDSLGPIYTVNMVMFSYAFPLIVISWTYFGIWREIRKSTLFHRSLDREAGSTGNNKVHKRISENARAKKILTPLVVTFAVTMLPVNIFRLLNTFWSPLTSIRYFWTLFNVTVIMTTANSAVNPIIYSVVSKDFRIAFIKLILQRENSVTSRLHSRTDAHTKLSSAKQQKSTPALIIKNWPDAAQLKETVL